MKEIAKHLGNGDMPLSSYTFIHRDAKLSNQQRNTIMNWARGI